MLTAAAPVRVLIVDDSAFMRRAIRNILEKEQGFEVVGTANNGLQALDSAKRLQPDVITLDIEMPEMDGLTALKQLKRLTQAAVLMVSSLTSDGSQSTLTALRLGASDFVTKDASSVPLDLPRFERDLRAKIQGLARDQKDRPAHRRWTPEGPADTGSARHEIPRLNLADFDVLFIGSSTGGPPVLEFILTRLPATFPLPILIAQHMPLLFTKVMAERLNGLSPLNVVHGEPEMPVTRGNVYIAPGGQHMRLRKAGLARFKLDISTQPATAIYKPSVDELMQSAAEACGSRGLGMVLTGMGADGLIGARLLVAAGGKLLAQDQDTCAVYGMPKAVAQAGITLASLNPAELVSTLKPLGG